MEANQNNSKSDLKTGFIKFYKKEDGYGFIHDGSNDFYFRIHDVHGESLPTAGMKCTFKVVKLKNSKVKAINVVLSNDFVDNSVNTAKDNRIQCPKCKKLIVPRLTFSKGYPKASYCPFCGEQIQLFSECFIATEVFQDRLAPEVIDLRHFRNKCLATNFFGKIFIRLYYKHGAKLANYLHNKPKIKKLIKTFLCKLAERFSY